MPLAIPAAILGAAAIGGVASAIGSSKAAKAQTNAAQMATDTQKQMYETTRGDLMPFQQMGQGAGNELTSRMGELTSPFNMTQANLEATPGYQFTRDQGLKSVNNAMGARGLLNSGAVMKGAAGYATGLADSTYMDQFNMDQQNKTNAYNKLLGVTQLGENAAAQTGAYGTQTAQNIGSNMIGAGNAQAAGIMGIANGIGGIGNSLSQYMMMKSLLGGGNSGGGGIFGSPATNAYGVNNGTGSPIY